MKRLDQETIEPIRQHKESDSCSNPAAIQDARTKLKRTQGTEETPPPTFVSVHGALEGEGAKKDKGASSSKLPVESPANADDTQDYMTLEEETHPALEGGK